MTSTSIPEPRQTIVVDMEVFDALYTALDRLVNQDMSKEAWTQARAALALARGDA